MTPVRHSEPTSLAIPGRALFAQDHQQQTPLWHEWIIPLVIIMVLLMLVMFNRRRARPVHERAFLRFARQSGLSRDQVKSLRKEAKRRGLESPVGLMVSPLLVREAIERSHP